MPIRRQLLLSFTAVTLLPVAIVLALASWYWRSARAELDHRFVEDAKAACERETNPLASVRQQLHEIHEPTVVAFGDHGKRMAVVALQAHMLEDDVDDMLKLPGAVAAGLWSYQSHTYAIWKARDGSTAPSSEALDAALASKNSDIDMYSERMFVGPSGISTIGLTWSRSACRHYASEATTCSCWRATS